MNTGEFLSRLEDALRGKVANQVIEANLQYYRDYITGEIRKGRTEEQVMDDLGDPRLIARTIIETQGGSGAGAGSGSSSAFGYSYSQQAERSSYRSETKVRRIQPWKVYLILILIIVVIFVIIGTVFSLAFRILLSPVFWALVMIGFAVQIFRGRR